MVVPLFPARGRGWGEDELSGRGVTVRRSEITRLAQLIRLSLLLTLFNASLTVILAVQFGKLLAIFRG